MKNITSSDPRKPAIVAAFKKLFGATKVTLVSERDSSGHIFVAHCLKHRSSGTAVRLPGVRAFISIGVRGVRLLPDGRFEVAHTDSSDAVALGLIES